MVYYAVAKGRTVGIYSSWADCEKEVKGFSGAKFKKFKNQKDAQDFLQSTQSAENELKSRNFSDIVKREQSTKLTAVKQEEFAGSQDYIPLDTPYQNIKKEIKEEPFDDSPCWFEDINGDKDLLLALSALQEYPDAKTGDRNNNGRGAKPKEVNKRVKIGNYNFTTDNDGFVDAYIGGNSENIGSWNCMAGYGVSFGPNHPLNVAEAASGRMTHNVGDLEAAIHAIKIAKQVGVKRICLHTSSEFLLKAVTSWMYAWKNNGWRNKNGKVVQNRKEFEQLNELLNDENIDVKWHNVKGYKDALKTMREVKKLAEIGTEEYLEMHPSKDDSVMSDFDFF